jgi:hypothetical protein
MIKATSAPSPRDRSIVEELRERLSRIHGPGERLNHCQVAGRIAASRGTTRPRIHPERRKAPRAPKPRLERGPRIYDLLIKAVTREMTINEVRVLFPERNPLSIRNELRDAVAAGDLRRPRKGSYAPVEAKHGNPE